MSKRANRRNEILDIAKATMIETGVDQTTMLRIANEAGASKETLYNWFGTKTGLVEALCVREADVMNHAIAAALADESQDMRTVLENLAIGLLRTLLGEWSLSINRAGMQSPEIAVTVLNSGRFSVGPLVEAYLEQQADRGAIRIFSGDDAFRLLFGLVMQDAQTRALLWNQADDPADYPARARVAVDRFLRLVAP